MQSICIAAGKGGVGTSIVACNLAWALADQGKSVLLLDSDFGAGSLDYILGVDPAVHLGHVAKDGRELKDCVARVRPGLDIIGGGGGIPELSHLTNEKAAEFCSAAWEIASQYDVLVIDSSSGLDLRNLSFQQKADILLLVTSPEPTSLLNSLALLSHVWATKPDARFAFVCNQVLKVKQGDVMAQHLKSVVGQFLSRNIEYWGSIRSDRAVKSGIIAQQLPLSTASKTGFSQDVRELAAHIAIELDDLANGIAPSEKSSILAQIKSQNSAEIDPAA
ncbi:P-loop NTPase [Kamptonema cortianum]|nr:P-loop NTPase [Geitlerinema splendidum]MDK3156890.1 P-loop NTPase [Kamptonema cortianum]